MHRKFKTSHVNPRASLLLASRMISRYARAHWHCDESSQSLKITVFTENEERRLKKVHQEMSCCSTNTAEDKLEPYQLRVLYIRQISRSAQKGIFGQAVNVYKEVCFWLVRWKVTTGKETALDNYTGQFHGKDNLLLLGTSKSLLVSN